MQKIDELNKIQTCRFILQFNMVDIIQFDGILEIHKARKDL